VKTLSYDLNGVINRDYITLLPFADWHDDDPNCNKEFVEMEVEAAKNEDTFVILHGDIVNFAFKSSKSDVYCSRKSPQESLDWAVETLYPIKDKILVLEDGNHEDRLWKECGIHAGRYIANSLGIKERYAENGALLFLSFGEQGGKFHNRPMCYTVYVVHGCGGGRKAGGKVNKVIDMMMTVDADIYLHGHTHLPFQTAMGFYRTCLSNKSVKFVNKLFVNSSSALNYGGYGEKLGYNPSAMAHIEISLDGSRRRMKASMEL
jgi:hypothetical protein